MKKRKIFLRVVLIVIGVIAIVVAFFSIIHYIKQSYKQKNDKVVKRLNFNFSGKVYDIKEITTHTGVVYIDNVSTEKIHDGRLFGLRYFLVINNERGELVTQFEKYAINDSIYYNQEENVINIVDAFGRRKESDKVGVGGGRADHIYSWARDISKM